MPTIEPDAIMVEMQDEIDRLKKRVEEDARTIEGTWRVSGMLSEAQDEIDMLREVIKAAHDSIKDGDKFGGFQYLHDALKQE